MTAVGKPRFPAADQRRRSMLAKVHIAWKELGLSPDDYRGVMFDLTGHHSAQFMTEEQLGRVLDHFKQRGWQQKKNAGVRAADHPIARKARALWISLYQLGAIDNASEQALEAFAQRQLGCERLQWANQRLGYRLIEALRAIADRHGWDQSVDGIDKTAVPIVLRRRLVEAIVARMKAIELIPQDWSIADAAWRLAGLETRSLILLSTDELHQLAQVLGGELRKAKARMGGAS